MTFLLHVTCQSGAVHTLTFDTAFARGLFVIALAQQPIDRGHLGGSIMSAHHDRAVDLLVNYFEAIAKKAGMTWDPDYTAEISEAVAEIVNAAVEAVRVDEESLNDRLIEVVRRLDKHERQLRAGGL